MCNCTPTQLIISILSVPSTGIRSAADPDLSAILEGAGWSEDWLLSSPAIRSLFVTPSLQLQMAKMINNFLIKLQVEWN